MNQKLFQIQLSRIDIQLMKENNKNHIILN